MNFVTNISIFFLKILIPNSFWSFFAACIHLIQSFPLFPFSWYSSWYTSSQYPFSRPLTFIASPSHLILFCDTSYVSSYYSIISFVMLLHRFSASFPPHVLHVLLMIFLSKISAATLSFWFVSHIPANSYHWSYYYFVNLWNILTMLDACSSYIYFLNWFCSSPAFVITTSK